MKNKIALYGEAEKLNQAENVLSKYLNENDVPFEIHRISDSRQFLREFLLKDDYMVSAKYDAYYILGLSNDIEALKNAITLKYNNGLAKGSMDVTALSY